MIESPEKSQRFYLQQTDAQRGYFFADSEVDPSFHELFGAVGRLENGGSGFVVETQRELLLMSARHCFWDLYFRGSPNYIIMPNGHKIHIFKEDILIVPTCPGDGVKRDIFISRIPDIYHDRLSHRLRLGLDSGDKQVEPGEICFSVGYPEAYLKHTKIKGPVLSAGRVAAIDGTQMLHTSRVEPGSSGSPLFNRDGRVIGINFMGTYVEDELINSDGYNSHYNPRLMGFAEMVVNLWSGRSVHFYQDIESIV